MNKTERKAFEAGFDAGYAKGQSDAGEGGSWLTPPSEPQAWKEFSKPNKEKLLSKRKVTIPKENLQGIRYNSPF